MIYEYECQACKKRATAVRSVADRHNGPECCDQVMEKRIFTAGQFSIHLFEGYKCVASGEKVTSQSQRDYLMDKNGWADAREFNSVPKQEQAQQEVPKELADAMHREGHADLL